MFGGNERTRGRVTGTEDPNYKGNAGELYAKIFNTFKLPDIKMEDVNTTTFTYLELVEKALPEKLTMDQVMHDICSQLLRGVRDYQERVMREYYLFCCSLFPSPIQACDFIIYEEHPPHLFFDNNVFAGAMTMGVYFKFKFLHISENFDDHPWIEIGRKQNNAV